MKRIWAEIQTLLLATILFNCAAFPASILCEDGAKQPSCPSGTYSLPVEIRAPESANLLSHANACSPSSHLAVAGSLDLSRGEIALDDNCDGAKDACIASLDLDPISCGYYYGKCKGAGQVQSDPCSADPCSAGCPNENCDLSVTLSASNQPPLTTMLAPSAATAAYLTVLAAVRPTGVVSFSWWNLGQGQRAWKDLDGTVTTTAGPAVSLVGTYLFVVAQGRDGGLYLNQGEVQGNFTGWQNMKFKSSSAPAATSSGKYTTVVALDASGHLSYTWWELGQGGTSWVPIPGGPSTQSAPTAMLIGNYLFIVMRAADGSLYLNQGTLGKPFVGWQPMTFSSSAAPSGSAFDKTSVVVARNAQGTVFYNSWVLGRKGNAWKSVGQSPPSNSQPVATLARGNYLFVVVAGKDGHLYTKQGNLGGPFTDWH